MGPLKSAKNANYLFKKEPFLNKAELAQVLITIVLAGFYLSFNKWGVDEVDYAYGLQNFLGITLAIFLILTTIILVQKYVGLMMGYRLQYEYSWLGLLIGFFTTFISYGVAPFFLPGGNRYETILHARLGKFRREHQDSEIFIIASLATIIPLLFTILFSTFYLATEDPLFRHLVVVGLLMAAFSLIPLPNMLAPHKWGMHGPTDIKILNKFSNGTYGFDMLTTSVAAYTILAVTTIFFILLVLLFEVYSLVLSILLAVVMLIIYKIAIKYFTK